MIFYFNQIYLIMNYKSKKKAIKTNLLIRLAIRVQAYG